MAYDPLPVAPASPAAGNSSDQMLKVGLGVVLGCVVLCGCVGTVLLAVLMVLPLIAN